MHEGGCVVNHRLLYVFVLHMVWTSCLGGWTSLALAQVSSSPRLLWQPPDLHDYTRALQQPEGSPLAPDKHYTLAELIDLAQRTNPETRVAWERAQQAAAAVGLVESEYYPVLALSASVGASRVTFPIPTNLVPQGHFRVDSAFFTPTLTLRWLLLDFGQRRAAYEAASAQLLAQNLGFNNAHQQIVFAVQKSFYALASARGRMAVAQAALDAATTVQQAAEARLQRGLATLPEVELARQQAVQARFDLEEVLTTERDAQVALAQSIGIPPTTPIQVTDVTAVPLPTTLAESVEQVISRALEQRPDLSAKVAAVRAREANVRRVQKEYGPKLSMEADVGGLFTTQQIDTGGSTTQHADEISPHYGARLLLTWPLFEGGARQRKLELAMSERRAAEADMEDSRDKAISQVWNAYTDVKLALRRLDVAAALVTASERSYASTLASYKLGLSTLLDLLAARRERSRAQFTALDTKARLLTASAALAFTTGDLGQELLRTTPRR
jgi:outer membrane protein